MWIGDTPVKKQLQNSRQDRIAEPVQPWHRPRFDPAAQSRTHHQVVAGAQSVHEALQVGQVVGLVRIRHQDEATAGFFEATAQCVSIATPRFFNDAGAGPPCHFCRPVVGTVVHHHYFARYPQTPHGLDRLGDTRTDGFDFVQAGQDDRQFAFRSVSRRNDGGQTIDTG